MAGNIEDYIKNKRAGGASDAQIKAELQEAGWSDDKINEIINNQGDEAKVLSVPKPTNSISSSFKMPGGTAMLLVLVFVVNSLGLLAFLYSDFWNPGWDPFYVADESHNTTEINKEDFATTEKENVEQAETEDTSSSNVGTEDTSSSSKNDSDLQRFSSAEEYLEYRKSNPYLSGEDNLIVYLGPAEGEASSSSSDIDTSVGINTDVIREENCGYEGCFDDKFKNCEPAKSFSLIPGFVGIYYEIIGPDDGGCRMTAKYPKNPNPEWEEKELICSYDNSIEFQKSFMSVYDSLVKGVDSPGTQTCEGPLVDILSAL
ncbi:MAG: hypothetical protein R3346_04910 [Candidatus Spechtbacterales bacterium]|nr:hypothetical protein [Candidatus Spechtbacterales bacterium]